MELEQTQYCMCLQPYHLLQVTFSPFLVVRCIKVLTSASSQKHYPAMATTDFISQGHSAYFWLSKQTRQCLRWSQPRWPHNDGEVDYESAVCGPPVDEDVLSATHFLTCLTSGASFRWKLAHTVATKVIIVRLACTRALARRVRSSWDEATNPHNRSWFLAPFIRANAGHLQHCCACLRPGKPIEKRLQPTWAEQLILGLWASLKIWH